MAEFPGHVFNRLVEILARLRAPDGCPWDREQTRTSLKPHLIEEAYEVLDALESSDPRHLAEELGDLLFQVMIHAQIASELGEFTIADVLTRLVDKMISRHPHVFGEASVSTAQEALTQWERLKRREALAACHHRSVLDGVPRALPALLRARIPEARIGFFLHIPFPSSEVFRVLPWRRDLLEGLLGATLRFLFLRPEGNVLTHRFLVLFFHYSLK